MNGPVSLSGAVVPPELFVYLPSLAVALAAVLYFSSHLMEGRAAMGIPRFGNRNASSVQAATTVDNQRYVVMSRRQLVLILQFLVGSLVTLGGVAYATFATSSFGTELGAGHLSIGLLGLAVGLVALRRSALPRSLLVAGNALTILYSAVSDTLAGIDSLLPPSAFHDSVIGTAIAIGMSGAIIYLLVGKR